MRAEAFWSSLVISATHFKTSLEKNSYIQRERNKMWQNVHFNSRWRIVGVHNKIIGTCFHLLFPSQTGGDHSLLRAPISVGQPSYPSWGTDGCSLSGASGPGCFSSWAWKRPILKPQTPPHARCALWAVLEPQVAEAVTGDIPPAPAPSKGSREG